MRLEDEIRAALGDVLLPELRVLNEDLQALRAEIGVRPAPAPAGPRGVAPAADASAAR